MMLEPGTGEALEIPASVSTLHDDELVEYSDEALASTFHSEWTAVHQTALRFDQCAGYRVPLFSGVTTWSQTSRSPTCVYWSLMGQLRLQAMHLPAGESISGIELG
jgi:hypothetical protein